MCGCPCNVHRGHVIRSNACTGQLALLQLALKTEEFKMAFVNFPFRGDRNVL